MFRHYHQFQSHIEFFSKRICERNSGYDIQKSCDQAVTGSTADCKEMEIRMDDLVDEGRSNPFKKYTIVTCTVENIIQNCIIAGQAEGSIQILNYSSRYKCHES